MKHSLFNDLDKIIERAVKNVVSSERSHQDKIAREIENLGINSKKNKNQQKAKKDVGEAEGEESETEKTGSDELKKDKTASDSTQDQAQGPKKITGAPSPDAAFRPTDAPGTRTSSNLEDLPVSRLANPKPEDVARKINVLRGGGSLKNKKIASSVDTYVRNLDTAEKASLVTFLTNLSQIMAPIKDPDEVRKPREVGIETRFADEFNKKSSEKSEKTKEEKPKEKSKVKPDEKEKDKEEKKSKPKGSGGVVVVGGD